MRLLLIGTGPFALPTFRGLYAAHNVVAALVTSPVRVHRGKEVAPMSPMRELAWEFGTPIFDPADINARESQVELARYKADLLVVCDYGQILSTSTLAAARLGGINLHASLLPKYRGAAPINWAIYHGETATGVTVIHMTPKVDAGPCIAQVEVPIRDDETAVELEKRLSESGAWLVRRTIDALESGALEALPAEPRPGLRRPAIEKNRRHYRLVPPGRRRLATRFGRWSP